jgi:D-alanine transaminase
MGSGADTVFLNGQFMPMHEAKISPMDRGFLFGDGVYEMVPCHNKRLVALELHMARLQNSLDGIGLKLNMCLKDWQNIAQNLMQQHTSDNVGIYFHVSRGADIKRFHAFPADIPPTIFAFAFEIPPAPVANRQLAKPIKVISSEDLRWKRCHIKSTSLLGNVLHFQHGQEAGVNETILYNSQYELTEASSCNVFIVKDNSVYTPPLDKQLLPGITRHILLDLLQKDLNIHMQERVITMQEVHAADEIWLTSSSKEVAAVVELDGKPVGKGEVGPVWQIAQNLFNANKYNY